MQGFDADSKALETKYERLLHLYYSALFQTIAIIFGFILGSIQIFSILLSSPPPHSTLLLVLFFLAGVGTAFYGARYFAGYYQLELVMKKLGIFELDYAILKRVDLFFIWKRLDPDTNDVSQNAARALQVLAVVAIAAVYAWVINTYWGIQPALLMIGTVGAIAFAFYLHWQAEEERPEPGAFVSVAREPEFSKAADAASKVSHVESKANHVAPQTTHGGRHNKTKKDRRD